MINAWPDGFLTSISRVITHNTVSLETLRQSAHLVFSKTQTSQVTWREICCPFWEATPSCFLAGLEKQTAVPHSSTDAEVVSLDAGLRLEGILALILWDTVIDVFGLPARSNPMHNRSKKKKSLMAEKKMTGSIDTVPPNA